MTREAYKMRGKRTDTYYVYDAYTDELVGCGSLAKISELFEITPRTLKKYAENGSLYASRNADNRLKFKRIDGIIEDVEPTIKVESGKVRIKRSRRLLCNFVEVFDVFKEPKTEEEKKYMRTHFSIINLEKVRFELDTRPFTDGFPFRINFVGKGRLRSIIFSEKFYSRKLAEERFEYLKNFQAKQCCGDFWYNKVKYDASRVVCVERTRNGKNKIMSPSCDTTKKTNYKEYLDLAQFLQSEFIR